jgi:hypothetical protein
MLAREKNRGDIAQSCVDVQCYYVLATMRPDERKHEVDEVWQVDKYRPNGQWNHITSAPILVDELLRIDAKTDKQINSILSAANDKWFAQFDAWTKDLAKEFPGKTWATMTEAEKQRYHARSQELRNNWLKGRTTADISTEHAVYVTKTMDEVRKLLSKSQLAEFNGIIAKFDKHMAAAYAGSKNPLGATGVGGGK